MTLKKCSQCARAIPLSSSACDHCGHTLDDAALPAHDSVPSSVPADAPVALETPRPRMNRGELATLLACAAGSAILIFALLSARGAASPAAASNGVAPVPSNAARSSAPAGLLAAPKWTAANSGHWVGNARKAVAFEVAAVNKVQVWTRQVQPLLVVRCIANRTEAFVFTDSAARMELQDEDHTVQIRFDDGPDATERWPDSEAHDALFAPDGAAFATRLASARTLAFGFTPHNAEPVTARFDVSGLGELMESNKSTRSHCRLGTGD